ncbi:class I SAM-dependent methyltransferase [Achromobacter xylosoxidans]|uniref:class I SAM-dependent methyltransferase n=1 Tax=Alcaligenes xylosoxydans xylosoxydans TaxID=85698 RepID=UPI0006C356F2|nr:class I SAM-dependent methyltransferase [Achromobacter xylosoxidans]MCH4573426.1 methyltransferase domain-containing protein [Achromobacter xylosoxidans]MDD7987663.1 methyltransferase domain-containing protein [Achromobacter xylosoxidans]NEV03453.1 methyltransferase domain-containing protein [Achromobacter xylosoxidans]PNL94815.1 methyltransferase domain-containing protein [Achromobacter xylosoxidans]CUJ28403.1 Predicted methyltransferase (contains TPR repeat) [Achromobacter xylosoxidans]
MSIDRADGKQKLCPVCCRAATVKIHDLQSPYINSLIYTVHKCSDCGHRFAVGPISQEILDAVYGAAFHSTSQQRAVGPESSIYINATQRVRWLTANNLHGKLLDVGAGRGYFVKIASSTFEAQGIDYSKNAAEYGRDLDICLSSGDFLEANYAPESFDVLTFWDVLASMIDVHATIQKSAQLLRHGGHAVFTLPMGDSLACRIAGARWPLWIPPVNLHYFSKDSIKTLLSQHGFEVVRMEYLAKRVSANFLLLKLARSFGLKRLEGPLAGASFSWAIPVNLGDILTVMAKKA